MTEKELLFDKLESGAGFFSTSQIHITIVYIYKNVMINIYDVNRNVFKYVWH